MKINRVSLIVSIFILSFKPRVYAQTFEWAKQFQGLEGGEHCTGFDVSPNGNCYFAGDISGSAYFDSTVLLYASLGRTFVGKYNSNGNLSWVKQFAISPTGGSDPLLTIDNDENIYLLNRFIDTIDFDPGPGVYNIYSPTPEMFISKLDSNGNFIWAKSFTNGPGNFVDIDLDPWGNILITGGFSSLCDFDPGPSLFNLSAGSTIQNYLLKLNSLGDFIWAKKTTSGGTNSYPTAFSLDTSGNIYCTGAFEGNIDFDPGASSFILSSASGLQNNFISKYSPLGDFLWAKKIICETHVSSIGVDLKGNNLTSTLFSGTHDFDPGPGTYTMSTSMTYAGALVMLDSLGDFQFSKKFDNYVPILDIIADKYGNWYVTGAFSPSFDAAPGPSVSTCISNGDLDVFICKYDPLINLIWAKSIGGTMQEMGHFIKLDTNNNVYTSGRFSSFMDFDPGPDTFNLSSTSDYYLHKMSECPQSSSNINITNCDYYVSPSLNYTWYSSGVYYDTLISSKGCDSVITINLTINAVDTSISLSSPTITSNAIGATFQWLDCNNEYTAITGETSGSFTAIQNGNYAVSIIQNSCADTTSCFLIDDIGINEINTFNFSIYPNPTNEFISINLSQTVDITTINVKSILNQNTVTYDFKNTSSMQFPLGNEAGVYLIEMFFDDAVVIQKVVKY